jgi:hypothetical protein
MPRDLSRTMSRDCLFYTGISNFRMNTLYWEGKVMALHEERRRYPRVRVSWPVTMLTASGPIAGEVRNIGLGGAFIQCREEPGPAEAFRLVIRIPQASRQFLLATGKMARSSVYDPDDLSSHGGIGVRFVEISEADRQFLEEIISARTSQTEAGARVR